MNLLEIKSQQITEGQVGFGHDAFSYNDVVGRRCGWVGLTLSVGLLSSISCIWRMGSRVLAKLFRR